jgi:hypothetical protein
MMLSSIIALYAALTAAEQRAAGQFAGMRKTDADLAASNPLLRPPSSMTSAWPSKPDALAAAVFFNKHDSR